MAERTILGIFLLLSLYQTYAALDVSAPSTQRALFTSDTNLNCSFSLDKQPMDPNFLVISWTFQGKVILRYDKKDFSTQDPRISLNMESLRDGYASLHISNVTISDRGTYICTVIYNAESKKKEISFKVFARPLLSIPSTKVQRNIENTLTCKATGFFPPDILITWYRNGEALRNHFMGKPQVYKDGTYHVDSTMTITPTNDDQNQTFFCRVQHESLQEPLQKALQLIYEAQPQLLQPVSRSLIASGELKYLVTLEKFYPRNITIRWTREVGKPKKILSSTEKFTNIPDGTYSVCSEVNIPEELLYNPEFRVRVSWKHESLDTPGYNDLSIRDSDAVLDVSTPSPQRALFTTDTILICTFSVDKQPPDLNFLVMSWTFQGRVILKYDNKGFSIQEPRMSLSVESLEHGNASLYLSNVTISDRGTYVCIVKYSIESKGKEISFEVLDPH